MAVVGLALLMMCLKGFQGPWHRYLFRFVLLFSYIIPISLRVNLDMGKAFYSWSIMKDAAIPGTVVRSTTIPEELGRVSYLLSDKTGTLTQNEMVFKKLHLGTASYGAETLDEVRTLLQQVATGFFSSLSTGSVFWFCPISAADLISFNSTLGLHVPVVYYDLIELIQTGPHRASAERPTRRPEPVVRQRRRRRRRRCGARW